MAIERWQPQRNHVYHMDAALLLDSLQPESVKLFITSPPYNLRTNNSSMSRGFKGKNGKWNPQLASGYDIHTDDMPRVEYVKWQRSALTLMLKALKPDGAIFYNHKARVQGGLMESPDEIVQGFPVRQRIIWNRGSGMNFNDAYFVPCYEFIYLIAKSDFRLRKGASGLGDVWAFPPETNNPHPAPFPEALPRRILDSVDTDLVVDPFGGSGTVAVAAQRKNVDFILCDLSPDYVQMAHERLRQPYMLNMFDFVSAAEQIVDTKFEAEAIELM